MKKACSSVNIIDIHVLVLYVKFRSNGASDRTRSFFIFWPVCFMYKSNTKTNIYVINNKRNQDKKSVMNISASSIFDGL